MQREGANCATHRIDIYAVGSVIKLFNNWGLFLDVK